MSLMRLLSSGRSWVGLKETSRYVMTDPRAMPKFGSGKNPFRGTATKAEPAAMPTLPATEGNCSVTKARTGQPGNLSDRVPVALASAVPSGALRAGKPSQSAGSRLRAMISTLRNSVRQVSGKLSSIIGTLSAGTAAPFRKLGSLVPQRRSRPRTAAIASFAKGSLQGELSLDRIKVVRNDLSDVDLEVVRRSENVPTAAPLLPDAPERSIQEAEQTAWAPGTPGLIGADKT